jgi:hypothetical protein
MTDINDPAVRPDVAVEWPEGEFPEQGGGQFVTILPGIDTFRLPANIAQLWHPLAIADERQFLANGQPNPTYKQKVARKQLKFDRNSPLVCVGGQWDGLPMTAQWSNNPRPRPWKKREDPKTPWISDLAYLLGVGLASPARPKTPEELVAEINKYAGKTVRLEHGLSAQCRPDKVRYILVKTAEGEANIQDPSGTKGCDTRYYTKDFRDPSTGKYETEIACDCGTPTPEQAAAGIMPVTVVLRGFENVDRILPPLGAGDPGVKPAA